MQKEDRFSLRAAVYAIFLKDGKVLLSRRCNTAWRNGEYSLVSGHADGGETMRTALRREIQEEVGVIVRAEDLEFAHVMHQYENHEYVDFYFAVKEWVGEIVNSEPEKCDDLQWFEIESLPTNIVPNVKQALEAYKDGVGYSELGLK
jgi:mutator protein MutT